MSDINEIHSIILMDNKSVSSYQKMIDALKPKNATKAYITVHKFEAMYELPDNYALPCHNLVLTISGTESAYANDPSSNVVIRSQVVDAFLTSQIVSIGAEKFAVYNVGNPTENWVRLNMGDLNDLRLVFRSASILSDFINPVSFASVPQFSFFLHLRVKFE
jgi:hypothetical protein